jgi:hypothetical protein
MLTRGWAILGLAIAAVAFPASGQRAGAQLPLFGFNEGYQVHQDELSLRSAAADSRAAGAQVARFPLVWGAVEPNRGRFDWAQYDRVYDQLLAVGIRPLPVLVDSPVWARPFRPRPPGTFAASYPDRRFLSDWERFAAAVAGRYPESIAIEVWNEPNSAHFWGGRPDPQRYAELLEAASAGIKAVRPAMPVLLGGPAARIGQELQWDSFLRRVYDHGAASFSDHLSLHPYATRDGPVVPQVIDQFRRAMELVESRHLGAGIWVTELGFSTRPRARRPVSELRQAELLADVYGRLREEGATAILIHRLREVESPNPTENGYGVTRVDGKRKPAFCALVLLFSAYRFC